MKDWNKEGKTKVNNQLYDETMGIRTKKIKRYVFDCKPINMKIISKYKF